MPEQLTVVTRVDLTTLPISVEQIREAVYLLENIIQHEHWFGAPPAESL